jgi:hypothetical protein
MTRLRSTSGGRCSHVSPEVSLGRETQSRLARGQEIQSRLTRGGRRSHDSSEATSQSRLARGWPRAGDTDTPCPRQPRSHDSPECGLGREMRSRLVRGYRRVGDAVTATPRPTSAGERSHDARGHLRAGDAVTPRPRPSPGGRRSHVSPETTLGRETQSHLARCQPRA